jgi:hypothetical protein
MDTDTPGVRLGTGPLLHGTYDEMLGTMLLFSVIDMDGKPIHPATYWCSCETRLVLSKKPPPDKQ